MIKQNEIGVYIHIPFCVSKCIYCDFVSMPADKTVHRDYVDALCKEINEFNKESECTYLVKTVFFGGGTPSILDSDLIARIINTLKNKLVFAKECEISIECNPGTVDREKLKTYYDKGINRISFGLQSVDNKELKNLGRIHTFEEFLDSYKWAREQGFSNINIDIMSALPGQRLQNWVKTLETVVNLSPEHISAYSLIVEEGTELSKQVQKGIDFQFPDEDEEREIYEVTKKILSNSNYKHYEISNYAKKGYECKHNKIYWTGGQYIGFGLNSASYMQGVRFSNTDILVEYLKNPIHNIKEKDILTIEDKMSEYMFLGLRMIQGVSKSEFYERFEKSIKEVFGDVLQKYSVQGLLEEKEDNIKLTKLGIDLSNIVFSDLLL